jgi:hypothetical protein
MWKPNLRNTTNHNKGNTEKHRTKAAEKVDANHPFQNRRMHRRKHRSPISRSRAVVENHPTYSQHGGYHRRYMRSERLAGNVHAVPAIRYHLSARNTPVRLTPTNSLEETAETATTAETNRSKGSNLSTLSKQKTSVPLLVLSLAGEVGCERAWVGKGGAVGVDGHFGRDTTSPDCTKIEGYPGEPKSTNVKSISMRYRNTGFC